MPAPATDPNPRRNDLWLGALACTALLLGAYAALRPPAPAPDTAAEIAQLRDEIAELRHSLALTRSQMSAPRDIGAVADLEQRLARVETSAPRPPATRSGDDPDIPDDRPDDRMPDGSPRYLDLKPPSGAVTVAQLPDGSLVATNRDPKLTGQTMRIKARTADGRDDELTIAVPPPG